MLQDPEVQRVRTLFISDLHLGTRGCQAVLLLEFLRSCEAETMYLIGDIIDGWRLRSGWYWPQSHNDVVQKLLRKVRKGTRIIYVPGNHDEFMRDYLGAHFGGVEVVDRIVHESADKKRYLVIHGDQFDVVVRHARWIAFLGDRAYTIALGLNTYVNMARRSMGLTYWSLSAWAKSRVKNAVNFIGRFEETLAQEAARSHVDGVICGHIHHATMKEIGGVRYLNTGDWVESCTALIERYDGVFEIVRWDGSARVSSQEDDFEDRAIDPAGKGQRAAA